MVLARTAGLSLDLSFPRSTYKSVSDRLQEIVQVPIPTVSWRENEAIPGGRVGCIVVDQGMGLHRKGEYDLRHWVKSPNEISFFYKPNQIEFNQ